MRAIESFIKKNNINYRWNIRFKNAKEPEKNIKMINLIIIRKKDVYKLLIHIKDHLIFKKNKAIEVLEYLQSIGTEAEAKGEVWNPIK